jgi:conjugal transfer pilus assembly protein TraU
MRKLALVAVFSFLAQSAFASVCKGSFINPLNICWKCLFPLSIGKMAVKGGELPDSNDNPSSPIGVCPDSKLGLRVGLNIGFWEPSAVTDVTDTPYCLPNLGGLKLNLGNGRGQGGHKSAQSTRHHTFYNVHWYKYPLLSWLNIITSVGCMQGGDFDIAFMTELDPTWDDSQMASVLNPEAFIFANPIAQSACAVDSIATIKGGLPNDGLFWCAGSQGSMYPFSGHSSSSQSPVASAILFSERLDYKMHRLGLIEDSTPVGDNLSSVCTTHYSPILKKSRYRYEMVNPVVDGNHCYPFGHTTIDWEKGHIKPNYPSQYGVLIWRKRNCTFL